MGETIIGVGYLRGGESRGARRSSQLPSHVIANSWTSVKVPLINIHTTQTPEGGAVTGVMIANSVPDKITLLKEYDPEAEVFIVPWPGRNTTDTFLIDDVPRILSIFEKHEE